MGDMIKILTDLQLDRKLARPLDKELERQSDSNTSRCFEVKGIRG